VEADRDRADRQLAGAGAGGKVGDRQGKIEWTGRIRPVTFSYTIDATKTPKPIDLEIVDGALGVGGKLKGIYKRTEGKLRVCWNRFQNRPSAISVQAMWTNPICKCGHHS
jgi:hypothetical protein